MRISDLTEDSQCGALLTCLSAHRGGKEYFFLSC